MVKVVPLEEEAPKKVRRLGFMKGQFKVPADFDTMYAEEICKMFEGEDDEGAKTTGREAAPRHASSDLGRQAVGSPNN